MSIAKKLAPWMLFIACLLFLGIGATPLGPIADHVFITLRFSVVIFLSILIVRRTLRKRPERILDSFTRWCRGENKREADTTS